MIKIYNKIEYNINDDYSFKDFTGRSNLEVSGIVYGSCFSQEIPDNHIFPNDMTGVTFIKCNLDNVFIPVGNTIIDCSQRRFFVQNDKNDWLINDWQDWLLDVNDKPTMPTNHKYFTKFGLPMPLPEDIPIAKADEPIDLIKVAEIKKLEII